MFEVEAKVWIKNPKQWHELIQKVEKNAVFEKEVLKEDCYFARKGEDQILFRLRIYDGKTYEICLKNKKIQNGVEFNAEENFQIDNYEAFTTLTKRLGLEVVLQKKKQSRIYKQEKMTLELNTVEGLGNFLEIECLCQNSKKRSVVRAKIMAIFLSYGFDIDDFEPRTYRELLLA